jgi:hypothetical protein
MGAIHVWSNNYNNNDCPANNLELRNRAIVILKSKAASIGSCPTLKHASGYGSLVDAAVLAARQHNMLTKHFYTPFAGFAPV